MSRRAGRKRKSGPREPNGQPQRHAVTPRMIAATMPHRRAFGDTAASHLAENALGRLLLAERISVPQHTAGSMYAAYVHAYLASIEGPRRPDRGSGRGLACGQCAEPGERFCLCETRKRAYLQMLGVLDRYQHSALYRTIVLDIEPGPGACMKLLLNGLSSLVALFHLTDERKSGM